MQHQHLGRHFEFSREIRGSKTNVNGTRSSRTEIPNRSFPVFFCKWQTPHPTPPHIFYCMTVKTVCSESRCFLQRAVCHLLICSMIESDLARNYHSPFAKELKTSHIQLLKKYLEVFSRIYL